MKLLQVTCFGPLQRKINTPTADAMGVLVSVVAEAGDHRDQHSLEASVY